MSVPLRDRKYALDVDPALGEQEVVVAGWVEEVRDLGGIAFVILRDRTGTLQVVLPKKKLDATLVDAFLAVNRESVIAIRGTAKPSEKARNGYEVLPIEMSVLNAAEAPLPLGVVDKVDADIDTRLDNRFMDVRKPDVAAIFKVRSTIVRAGARSFHDQGFVQIHTPRIIGASSEGGTDLFSVKYFDRDAYLAQSPQLYKQMMMATGLDRVFEVATYFRAEKHNTNRHLNEVTAFDLEMAFIEDEEDVMGVLEVAVRDIWQAVADENKAELALLDVTVKVPELPLPRVTYDEAVKLVNDSGKLAKAMEWGEDLSSEAERILGGIMEERGFEFYFITRYPEAIKPFYVNVEDGTPLSRSFDLDHKGLEITSGAQREHNPAKLAARIAEKGLDASDFEGYLKAFRFGMPPHGGFGLGIDRLTMELLGLENVREGVLFPRDRTRLSP